MNLYLTPEQFYRLIEEDAVVVDKQDEFEPFEKESQSLKVMEDSASALYKAKYVRANLDELDKDPEAYGQEDWELLMWAYRLAIQSEVHHSG